MRRRDPSEHQIQVAFFSWWAWACRGFGVPECLCFAVPNGGLRKKGVAGKLKAEGARAGTSDVLMLVPRGHFHGLVLEFKSKKGRPTPEQLAFLTAVRRLDYNAVVVYSLDEAIRVASIYLAQRKIDNSCSMGPQSRESQPDIYRLPTGSRRNVTTPPL